MVLGAYRFHGDPAELLDAYHRLSIELSVDALELHICVETVDAIVVFDACPNDAMFRTFSTGAEFTGVCRRAGLPAPAIEPIGELRKARLRETVTR